MGSTAAVAAREAGREGAGSGEERAGLVFMPLRLRERADRCRDGASNGARPWRSQQQGRAQQECAATAKSPAT